MRHSIVVTFEELKGSDFLSTYLYRVGDVVTKGKRSYRVDKVRMLLSGYEFMLTPC